MTNYSPILTSFNGGELSPRMHGRVDQGIYAVGAAEMFNFGPAVEGPAMKRSGFRFIRAAMASSTWLTRFAFSVTQSYVEEWGEATLRFFTNGARIETAPGVAYEVAVPFTAAEAPAVSLQQSYDRQYMAHGAHAPASLLRTSAITFAYAALTLKSGPFKDTNTDKTKTVSVTGGSYEVGGAANLTASGAIFLAGHIGAPFLMEATGFTDIKAWEPNVKNTTLSVGDLRRSDGKVYKATAIVDSDGRTGGIQPTHFEGREWDGSGQPAAGTTDDHSGVEWEYIHDRFGVGTITAIGGGGTTATITVTRRLPGMLDDGTYKYAHGAFSAVEGWPKHVLLAFGRLIYFTDFEIVASVAGDYGGGTVNMAPFTESGLLAPDMAFRRRLSISNPILWAKEDRDVILIGTADGPYAIRKINSGEIFSSDNIECVKQMHFGCDPIEPVQSGVSTIFVQRGGRKLREANYTLDSDRYSAPNLNVWQRHILKSGARQLAFEANPEELLWVVRNDGLLALHPHVPEQEVRGFARAGHAAGEVLSAVSIPSDDGTLDELWALVDGPAGKSIEQQAPAWEEEETAIADAFFVDSGVSYDGAARNSFPAPASAGAIDHLAGLAVAVLADGAVVTGLTVSAGPNATVALPGGKTAAKVHIGLGYQARFKWLRPELRDRAGNTSQGKRKRLVGIILRLLETCGIKVDPGTGTADNIIDRLGSAPMDTPVPPYTGDTPHQAIGGDWDRDAQGTVISDDPLPCMIVAVMPTIAAGE